MPNLLFAIPASSPQELSELLVRAEHIRIERIVSYGQASPPDFWYDQAESEFVLVVQGAARLAFKDESIELKPGDWVNIPAHRLHRVEWTTPEQATIWLAIFYD